jgi:hypothetical protein
MAGVCTAHRLEHGAEVPRPHPQSAFAPCRNVGDCFTGNPRTVTGTISYRF